MKRHWVLSALGAVRRGKNLPVTHSPSAPRQGWRCTQLSKPVGVASLADPDISAVYWLHFTTAQRKQKVGSERTEKQYSIFYLYFSKT